MRNDKAEHRFDRARLRLAQVAATLSLACGMDGNAYAGLTDCSDLYVGSVWIEQGTGLYAVVLLQNEGDMSGSYWMYFTQYSVDERKSALALLTAAKVSHHRVHVKTHAADGCSILATSQYVKSVYMAHRP